VGAGGEGHRLAGELTGWMPDAAAIAIIAGAFLLAGAVKGVIGMGLPTVAMGALGLVMPPVQAAALLVVPSLATNVWQMLAGPALAAAVRRFATMLIGVGVGIFLGIGLLTGGAGARSPRGCSAASWRSTAHSV
jgi:uncharacterized protein